MNNSGMPQCMSTVRFHEMLLNGSLGEREMQALQTNRRLSDKYRGLRSCDEAFNAMLDMGRAVANQENVSQKPPELLYAEYLYCTGGALCEKPLYEWAACVKTLQSMDKDIEHCAQAKRMVERCMRGKTEELLRASQPQVFRPQATP